MLSTELSRPRRKRARLALAAALIAVGCSGGSGGGCGNSCGGAFLTKNPDGTPFKYTGDRLDNVAQVRLTQHAFNNFLTAQKLNDIVASVGGTSGLHIPCIDAGACRLNPRAPSIPACPLFADVTGGMCCRAARCIGQALHSHRSGYNTNRLSQTGCTIQGGVGQNAEGRRVIRGAGAGEAYCKNGIAQLSDRFR